MTKLSCFNLKFIKFLWLLLLTAGSSVLASGTTFTVTNTNDSGAGSLRQAVADANAAPSDDVIQFDPTVFNTAQVITLTNGGLSIANNGSLIINSRDPNLLTVSGNNQRGGVLYVGGSANVIINGITIANGNAYAPGTSGEGGGIGNFGTLSVNNSIIRNNFATFEGGGIYNNGTLSINNSRVSNNSSPGGGGIFHQVGIVTINNSIVSENSGGGISTRNLVNINNTTINNNISGGIYNHGGAVNLNNSTISSNFNNSVGGGILIEAGILNLINTTVAFNSASAANGGGIYVNNINTTVNSRNSIIARNTGGSTASDFAGTLNSQGYNLIGSTAFTTITGNTTGNQLNVDPQLDPHLSNNGGVTPTHALRVNSTAIDGGDNCVLITTANGGCIDPNITVDQRGFARPQDGDGDGTAIVDIGAFEATRAEVAIAPLIAPDLQATNDTGTSNTDNITSSTNLSFNVGGLTSGATVELLRDGVVVASGTAAGDIIVLSDPNVTTNGIHLYTSRQIINNVQSLQSIALPITVDNTAPTVTINRASGQANSTRNQPINFSIVFSEPVSGFDAADISLNGSTANVSTATITVTGSGNVYNVKIGNITSSGQVQASVIAGAAQDAAGNLSSASTNIGNIITVILKNTFFDFDGDGKADVSVYRPSNGVWYLLNSTSGFNAVQFGISTDKIAPADFDGDGKTDVAVFRDGTWYLQRSSAGFASVQFGSAGDIPAPADFNGDGRAELVVFRPSNGTWYTFNLVNSAFTAVQFGSAGDIAVNADHDGDGKADYAVYRPSTGIWYMLQSTKGFTAVQFGSSTDKPVVADYDGDGKDDIAVFRPSENNWYLLKSTLGFAVTQFGSAGDIPAPADYDGDGKTDIAVFRPSSGYWYQLRSTQGFSAVQFGANGDRPIPNAFVP